MGVTDQTEMAVDKIASSRLSTSLAGTQLSQSDAITWGIDCFTLSEQKAQYYQKFLGNDLHSAV
jgi:hypothetical protein